MRSGVKTVGALASLSPEELSAIRNIGAHSLAEINARLAAYAAETNFSIGEPTPRDGDQLAPAGPQLHAIPAARPGLPAKSNTPTLIVVPFETTSRSPRRLPAWPDIWPDKLRDGRSLMEFVAVAVASLDRRPTIQQFLLDLLFWARRRPNKSARYFQSLLDTCYILGLIEDVNYVRQHELVLSAPVVAAIGEDALRDHCRRSALVRLENGLQLLRESHGVPFDSARLAAKLDMTEGAVQANVTLFRYLGLVETAFGAPTRVPPSIMAAYLSDDAPPPHPKPDARPPVGEEQQVAGVVRLKACPALLPDRPGIANSFLMSILFAHEMLETGVTTDQFLRRMITWAGREYPKSNTYYQNVLDAYYVVGLIPYTNYSTGRDAQLQSCLPADIGMLTLREYCISSALERLEKGPMLLEAAERLGSFTSRDIQPALEITLVNSTRHIRLFSSIGALLHEGLTYRLSYQVSRFIDEKPVTHAVRYEPASVREPRSSYDDYEDGLESLAFIG